MFRFRPLRHDDLDTLARWFSAPHARAWYGEARGAKRSEPRARGAWGAEPPIVEDLAEIRAQYVPVIDGAVPIHAFVVQHEGRDIGLVEWERLGDFPEVQAAYGVEDPDVSNCDVLIGEPDAAHRGLGAPLVRAFLREIVFADPRITGCVIDPESDNAIAIRCYEKAGFRFLRAVAEDTEGGSVHLLELRRDELDPPRLSPPVWLRPARANELATAVDIDEDACAAYDAIGMHVSFSDDHPFARDERARWQRALTEGRLLFACAGEGAPIGFAAFGLVDGRPFLHQLSVRLGHARRGVGKALLARVVQWAMRPGEVWLTTYDHVAWNRPWYEREGFRVVSPDAAGPELRAILDAERALPDAQHRVLMVRR